MPEATFLRGEIKDVTGVGGDEKDDDHLLPWQAYRIYQLRLCYITHHFMALMPIFDHKQGPNFDLKRNSTKRTNGIFFIGSLYLEYFPTYRIFLFWKHSLLCAVPTNSTAGVFFVFFVKMCFNKIMSLLWNMKPIPYKSKEFLRRGEKRNNPRLSLHHPFALMRTQHLHVSVNLTLTTNHRGNNVSESIGKLIVGVAGTLNTH